MNNSKVCIFFILIVLIFSFSIAVTVSLQDMDPLDNPVYAVIGFIIFVGTGFLVVPIAIINCYNVSYGKTEKEMDSYSKSRQKRKLIEETTFSQQITNILSFPFYSYPKSLVLK